MRVAVVRDVEVVGLQARRQQLDGKLNETAEGAFDGAWRPAAPGQPEGRTNEHAFHVAETGKVRRELLGREIHARPLFLQKVGDNRDSRQ